MLGVGIGRFGSVVNIIGLAYRLSVYKYDKSITEPIRYPLSVNRLLTIIGLPDKINQSTVKKKRQSTRVKQKKKKNSHIIYYPFLRYGHN